MDRSPNPYQNSTSLSSGFADTSGSLSHANKAGRRDPAEQTGLLQTPDPDSGQDFDAGRTESQEQPRPALLSAVWRRRLVKLVPRLVLRKSMGVWAWIKGPDPSIICRIRPVLGRAQRAPSRLLDWIAPSRAGKIIVLGLFYILWVAIFVVLVSRSARSEQFNNYGEPTSLTCSSSLWSQRNECGLNGRFCTPFDNVTVPIRCPAGCKLTELLEPYGVGGSLEEYRQLVIGGGPVGNASGQPYRADSSVCIAAIHAGFLSDKTGGCGLVAVTGAHAGFESVDGNSGISSIGFDSYFPKSFRFVDGSAAGCKDERWNILAFSIVFTTFFSIFATSPAVFFFTLFISLFMHTALVSDPPAEARGRYDELVSIMAGRLLPSLFVGYVIWRWPVRNLHRKTLGRVAPIERAILWLGPAWVGTLNNLTFDRLPLSRLTPHDLRQPGAIVVVIVVALVILAAALTQGWYLRLEGRLPRFLALYGFLGSLIVVFVLLPDLSFRFHHYVMALILLPGTGTQTRVSLVFQGLLVGLFVNGIARWGYDSILQTGSQLRGSAALESPLPVLLPDYPVINLNSGTGLAPNITFRWQGPTTDDQSWSSDWMFDGVSILVNDVERFNTADDGTEKSREFVWQRKSGEWPEYFRFAYVSGQSTADYTKAGTWSADTRSWTRPLPGVSN